MTEEPVAYQLGIVEPHTSEASARPSRSRESSATTSSGDGTGKAKLISLHTSPTDRLCSPITADASKRGPKTLEAKLHMSATAVDEEPRVADVPTQAMPVSGDAAVACEAMPSPRRGMATSVPWAPS